ncbi:MAG: hypothetical protein AAGB19_18255 [Cyanobacteria bacterium P01_F01_bin.3]
MSNPPHPSQQRDDRKPYPDPRVPAMPTFELYQAGYQQALKDFAIADLLHCLNAYSDANFDASWTALATHEAETLAAVLIQALCNNLNGGFLATYLNTIRHPPLDTFTPLTKLHLVPPVSELPTTFPEVEIPRFLCGDRLRWKTQNDTTDWGIVIGRFYSFAPHRCHWHWCYLIWLDLDSPSAAWVKADIAWEDDLEPLETEPAL